MPFYTEKHFVDYSAEQLFDIVLDIEKYPQFLPWCSGARIIERLDNVIIAELLVRFENISTSYVSRVSFDKPNKVKVVQIEGPFKFLENSWQFQTQSNGKTELIFEINFEFKSKLLNKISDLFLDHAAKKISKAFIKRAQDII